MELHGKIRNFGAYNAFQMEQMKADLAIAMPTAFLHHCANYYKTQAKRDPSIDEIKMLDSLACAIQLAPASCAPVELHTNDAFVANTYADMMEKRHILRPDAKSPMSFGEAIGLANAYLARAGRRNELPGTPIYSESLESNPFSVEKNCVGSASGVQLRLLSNCSIPRRADDLLAILLPETGKSLTPKASHFALNKLINDPFFSALIQKLAPISKGGILSAVLSEVSGAWIDLNRLSQSGEPLPLSALVQSFEEGYFIRLPRENEEKIYQMAKKQGVRALIFATLTTKDQIVLHRSQQEHISIHTSFFRSICTLHSVKLKLQNEADGTLNKADCHPICPLSCAYLARKEEIPSPVARANDLTCTVGCAELKDAFYLNAFYTALLPVIHQTLAGAPYMGQKLTVLLQTPDARSHASSCASAILGLYRLQAELGIAASEPALRANPETEHPTLTVFSVAKGTPYPGVFQKAENRVYLLKPHVLESRLPDFNSLRKFLDRLYSMQMNGIVSSAYVLCNESPLQGLKQMEDERIYCNLLDGAQLTAPAEPLAVLMETPYELAEAELIGTVALRETEPIPITPAPTIAPARSLIWSEKPEIVLLAKSDDAHAKMLTAVLNQRGATATLFSTAEGNELPLSHALLTSQTLILCGNVDLPHTPEVNFAYQTMRHAGGRVLFVGEREEQSASGIAFPNGFSEENLQALCKKQVVF